MVTEKYTNPHLMKKCQPKYLQYIGAGGQNGRKTFWIRHLAGDVLQHLLGFRLHRKHHVFWIKVRGSTCWVEWARFWCGKDGGERVGYSIYNWLVVSNISYFHPEPWGNDDYYFSNGLKPPNQTTFLIRCIYLITLLYPTLQFRLGDKHQYSIS